MLRAPAVVDDFDQLRPIFYLAARLTLNAIIQFKVLPADHVGYTNAKYTSVERSCVFTVEYATRKGERKREYATSSSITALLVVSRRLKESPIECSRVQKPARSSRFPLATES